MIFIDMSRYFLACSIEVSHVTYSIFIIFLPVSGYKSYLFHGNVKEKNRSSEEERFEYSYVLIPDRKPGGLHEE